MKKIGIVGGIAWPSTVAYDTGLCRLSEARRSSAGSQDIALIPEMVIESLDHDKAAALVGNDADEASWSGFDAYHRTALQRLERSGAEFALIASNTSHHRFAQITLGIGIPVLNIFEAVATECDRIRARHVLILGTALIMGSAKFRETFAAYGIEASDPRNQDARRLTAQLSEELQHGTDDAAAAWLANIVRMCRTQFTTQPMVCLACTELPLALPEQRTRTTFESGGIRYVNFMAVHILAAFECAVEGP